MAENTESAATANTAAAPSSSPSPSPSPPRADKLLDLIALLSLLAAMTGVYLATGPEVFAAVTGVSAGLFTTWRGRQNSD